MRIITLDFSKTIFHLPKAKMTHWPFDLWMLFKSWRIIYNMLCIYQELTWLLARPALLPHLYCYVWRPTYVCQRRPSRRCLASGYRDRTRNHLWRLWTVSVTSGRSIWHLTLHPGLELFKNQGKYCHYHTYNHYLSLNNDGSL